MKARRQIGGRYLARVRGAFRGGQGAPEAAGGPTGQPEARRRDTGHPGAKGWQRFTGQEGRLESDGRSYSAVATQ